MPEFASNTVKMPNSNPKTKLISRLLSALLLVCVVGSFTGINTASGADNSQLQASAEQAAALLSKMSPAEKVGQLFVVTFDGIDTGAESQIFDLIARKSIGGVMLRGDRNNFIGPDGTINAATLLIQDLQTTEWNSSTLTATPLEGIQPTTYIPLLVGIAQEGGGAPNDQIFAGLTPLPSQLAVGATWDRESAKKMGETLGKELNGIGVNLLLGPSLDVLESPWMENGDDLGVHSFGGDPYWVGELGKAYIEGAHTGSANQMLIIARHFPGRGAADRPLDKEVATVRKSLEQLKQIELAPFFAVTNQLAGSAQADGMLVSHIRYQGFQGNIRATTKPVSLDPSALSQILALSEFSAWREAGGVMMSDDLGSLAIRRFVDPTEQTFDARQTARSAFLAGNDLLYVGQFAGTGDSDSYTSIVNTLEFFTQRYAQDNSFAQRVDQSVLRILTLKFKLYPNFTLGEVTPSGLSAGAVEGEIQLEANVVQQAVTLIDPSPSELVTVLPEPPSRRENVVFLMDSLKVRQCDTCQEFSDPAPDALEKAILRAYGPNATNQVVDDRMVSYSFSAVTDWLDNINQPETFETDLRQANWIVVGMLKPDPNRPISLAFKRLMSEKSEFLRNKKVVVFALGAPYYLDATDISMITAYYGLYGKSTASMDEAAHILFQEFPARGSSPVSIPGVGYDLIQATSPDPAQLIPLLLDLPEPPELIPAEAAVVNPTPTPEPEFKIGDTLPMRTGVIVDHNGHPVPDGTVVRFIINTGGETVTTQQIEAVTTLGIARASYRINDKGMLQIHVVSEPAENSSILQLDVPANAGAVVLAVTPTSLPTITPVVTVTPEQEPTASIAAVLDEGSPKPAFWEWLLVVLLISGGTYFAFTIGKRLYSARWGIRWGLCVVLAGLICYVYLAGNLPGGGAWLKLTGTSGLLGGVLISMGLGWAGGVIWHGFTGAHYKTN